MSEEKKELTQEDIDEVSGGFLMDAHGCGHDHLAYEVIGDKGNIIGSFNTKEDAENFAKSKNISTRQLTWNELNNLRNSSAMIDAFLKNHRIPINYQPGIRPKVYTPKPSRKPIFQNPIKKVADWLNEDISGK